MNHREVLGVNANASAKEIKSAFRQAAKELHPDHSNSPEAAEAFARIKKAHDELLKQADTPRESTTVRSSAAHAATSTAQTTYASPDPQQSQMSDEELERIQDLDQKARESSKQSFFRRSKEPEEVKRHRKKLKTNERRLRGLY